MELSNLDKKYRIILNQYLNTINIEIGKVYSDLEFKLITAISSYSISSLENGIPIPLRKQISEIIKNLNKNSEKIILAGAKSSWMLSNKKNDELVSKFFAGRQVSDELMRKYSQVNEGALKSFLERKTNGLNLSERVWQYNSRYKDEIDTALQIGIGNGVSSNDLAKYLTRYLQDTDSTIFQVDKKGIAKKYNLNPGTGIYREPKKNAMRLARTEINMSYDTADWTRYQQLDFVLGYEVHLSKNHTTKQGKKIVKLVDICDRLAGKYPKTFKFTGWHPQCRCYMTAILPQQDERFAKYSQMLKGEKPDDYKGVISDVPEQFKNWIADNSNSLQKSRSLPYFVRDNKKYFDGIKFSKIGKEQLKEGDK